MPLLPEMKIACETNDTALARIHLKHAAENDQNNGHTRLSDSLDVAIAHKSNEVAELLFSMIKGYYRDDPAYLLLALTSNGISKLRTNGNVVLADKIQGEIVRSAIQLIQSHPDIVMNAFEVNDAVMAERLLAAGTDPDMRGDSFKKHSPLSLAAKNNAADTAQVVFDALKKKYKTEPAKLREALTRAPKPDDRPEGVLRSQGHFYLADSIAYELDVLDGRNPQIPVAKPIPRSSNPPPLKADQTLTLTRLQETKQDGRSNLQIFAEQGQLGDVFTTEIWQGRRAEMDKVWALVPVQHQNQVNIELVRAQIGITEGRARFSTGTDDRSQGF